MIVELFGELLLLLQWVGGDVASTLISFRFARCYRIVGVMVMMMIIIMPLMTKGEGGDRDREYKGEKKKKKKVMETEKRRRRIIVVTAYVCEFDAARDQAL